MSKNALPTDASGFVVLSEFVPHIIQEIRYQSTYNFIGERIDQLAEIGDPVEFPGEETVENVGNERRDVKCEADRILTFYEQNNERNDHRHAQTA